MQLNELDIGSYSVAQHALMSNYEDECVGSQPQELEGIVVSRIEGRKVFVKEWRIVSHFVGKQTLERFEEAKHNHNFEFAFSGEREMQDSEVLDGSDIKLREHLRKELRQ